MITILRNAIALLSCLALLACTTTQAISYNDPAELHGKVRVGDEVELLHDSGRTLRFTVSEVTHQSISGDGNTILWESIDGIHVRRFSAGKTAAATAGVGSVLLVAVAIAGMIAFGKAFEAFAESLGKCLFGGCKDDDEDD